MQRRHGLQSAEFFECACFHWDPLGLLNVKAARGGKWLTVSHTRRIARQLFAAIAAFESSFLSRIDLPAGCSLLGKWNRRKPQPRLHTVQEFAEGNGLLGRPATCTNSKFQRTPRASFAIEHGNALFHALAKDRCAGLRCVDGGAANCDSPRRAMMSVPRKPPASSAATSRKELSTAMGPCPARSAARLSILMHS